MLSAVIVAGAAVALVLKWRGAQAVAPNVDPVLVLLVVVLLCGSHWA